MGTAGEDKVLQVLSFVYDDFVNFLNAKAKFNMSFYMYDLLVRNMLYDRKPKPGPYRQLTSLVGCLQLYPFRDKANANETCLI